MAKRITSAEAVGYSENLRVVQFLIAQLISLKIRVLYYTVP